MKLAAALAFFVLVGATLAVEPPGSTTEVRDHKEDAARYFREYLSKCGEHEIRCIQFLEKQEKVAMVMTLDLRAATSYTVRHVHDWALQNESTRKLSNPQVVTLKELIKNLPASSDHVDFASGIHVAVWEKNAVVTRVYSPEAVPVEIRRIYDIGGGYLDAKEAK